MNQTIFDFVILAIDTWTNILRRSSKLTGEVTPGKLYINNPEDFNSICFRCFIGIKKWHFLSF